MTGGDERFTLVTVEPGNPIASFAEEVRAGLTARPKYLECRYFYDEEGSRLFEAIGELPEYYVTRAERQILEEHAGEIVAGLPAGTSLVELGSGSATKTRHLIEALLRRQGTPARQGIPFHQGTQERHVGATACQPSLRYVPLDISRSMLEESSLQLLAAYPQLCINAVAAEYQDGLQHLAGSRASHVHEGGLAAPAGAGKSGPQLVLWLGSNVGNFERPAAAAFLRQVRQTMGPQDRLLIGIDLRKDRSVLEPAYDDAQGVTAQFNKNLLARINRELGGHFDLDQFTHRAVYDESAGRIEMYLVSRRDQVVQIDALELDVAFVMGEAIHTENSYKYSDAEILSLAQAAGYAVERRWLDRAGRFSENLFRPC